MSLLMDALKKAEAAKRQGADEVPATEETATGSKYGELSLEAIDLPPQEEPKDPVDEHRPGEFGAAPAKLPKLPANLGGLDAEFVAHHEEHKAASKLSSHSGSVSSSNTSAEKPSVAAYTPAAAKAKANLSDPGKQADRDAARNVFDAKAKTTPAGNRKFAIAMGVLTTAVTLGAVAYFWWQLQPKSGFPGGNVAPRPAATVTPAPTGAATQTAQAPTIAGAPGATMDSTAATPPGASGTNAVTPALSPTRAPVPMQTERKKRAEPASDDAGDEAVRLVRVSKSPLKINPLLVSGYENFNHGDFAAAKTNYASVLKAEPQNTEALHGLAAIALRDGQLGLADSYYERILIADPKDAAALSAMINLHRQNDPVAAESRLQALAAEQPGSASTHFALGNLYASQKRWGDAQQAYFKAYAADPDNPDILYNLAVSLEHMKQPKLAYQYYALALETATRRPAGFDTAAAGARAAALKP